LILYWGAFLRRISSSFSARNFAVLLHRTSLVLVRTYF
jgi:hypothetical protein